MITFDIVSIGCLASEIQSPVSVIRSVAAQLNIVPTGHINNIPHFNGDDAARIADHIRGRDESSRPDPERGLEVISTEQGRDPLMET